LESKPLRAALSAAYLEVDPRSLGLFRILFGLVLLGDLIRHIPGVSTWFAADGVVPPSVVFVIERNRVPLSLFLAFPSTPAFVVGFTLFALVYLAYLFGFRTRLAQVLVIAALVTLHGRASIIEHAGERSMHLLALLTAFLPLGARYSIDAIRARRPDQPATTAPARSIAVLAILLQLAAVYVLDWSVKLNGTNWRNGSAIIGAIQPMTGTPLGFFIRDRAPLLFLQGLSQGTLVLEFILWPLLLLPLPSLRVVAAIAMVVLHVGIWSLMNIGIFQPTMIAPAALLLAPTAWTWLEETPRLAKPRAVLGRVRDRLVRLVPPATRTPTPPRRPIVVLREVGAAALLACLTLTVLNENDGVPDALHTRAAARLRPLFSRIGVFERWDHYNNPPTRDAILAVDAVTRDGRHVDPVNLDAFGYRGPPLDAVPPRAGLTMLWWNYEKGFRDEKQRLLPALGAWIERFPIRTGRAEDEIESYEVRWIVTTRDYRGNTLTSKIDVLAACERDRGCH
jgi:hypothetical protein